MGIPPIVTPLGYMLFLIGFRTGFKDWYFAEGGNEELHKLQGYRVLNSQHAKVKIEETIYNQITPFGQPILSFRIIDNVAQLRWLSNM